MEVMTVLIAILSVLIFLLYKKLTKYRGYIESLGIPLNTSKHFFRQNLDFVQNDVDCMNKFGLTWGSYRGIRPEIMIAEPELIREIMVKKFDYFPNHIDTGVIEEHLNLVDARDDKWRAIRKGLSPTFTSGKLKGMMDHIENVADNMIHWLEEKTKQAPDGIVNIKEIFQGLSLDTIANCAFGIETNSFKDPGNALFQRCISAFTDMRIQDHAANFVFHLFDHFPDVVPYLDTYGKDNYTYLRNVTRDIVQSRTQKRGGDFIDRLKEMLEDLKDPKGEKILTEEIILAQGIVFFIAGFETSSNTLTTLSYNLAKNLDVQDRIAEEVKSVLENFNGRIDYETINQMPFMEAAIHENLRLFPPVTRLDRYCSEDCTIGPYKIRKGSEVIFPIYAMHHNHKFFPEPEKFKPERFLKSEDGTESPVLQYTYIPFGGGPRQCIGMRFAIAEIKIAMAKLIANFEIIDTPQTKLERQPGDPFLLNYPSMNVKLQKRLL